MIRAVTAIAIEPRMFALELPPGEHVIEGALSFLTPPHERVVPPLMLDVALLARSISDFRVEPGPRIHALGQRRVAGQALRGRKFAPDLMAARAILHPFEI